MPERIPTLSDICNKDWFDAFEPPYITDTVRYYLSMHSDELALEILVNYNFPIHAMFATISPSRTQQLFLAHYEIALERLYDILVKYPTYDATSNTKTREVKDHSGSDTSRNSGGTTTTIQNVFSQNYSTTYDNATGGATSPAGLPTTATENHGSSTLNDTRSNTLEHGLSITTDREGSNGGEPIQNLLNHELDFRTSAIFLEIICKMCMDTFCNGVVESEGFYGD